jgi:hypothetical protein
MSQSTRLLLCGTLLLTGACNLNSFAANQAASIAGASNEYMRGFWDYDIARHGMSAAIMQLEAMHSVSPDNETLTLTLVSTYVGYGFGFVELDLAEAQAALHFDQADRLRARAELIYRRARDLALSTLRRRDASIDEMLLGDPSALTAYLKQHYPDPNDDVPSVFWTAVSWGSMLNMTDQLDQAADLPSVRAMVEHVVALNPGYESASGLVFLGGLYSQTPADFGGDPVKGKAYFERALALTKHKSHTVQLAYAKLYALTNGDQTLFHSLLDEILAPEDQGNAVRLSNKIARMHAERLLKSQSPSH